eukprot:c11680_g1_i2.p1 GENE.c11680_g1_i2~~c11680_g1_i2.p1  ORF type:complete len:406 (-),score=82.93 c11680_g1_i2:900-2117(-)
MGRMTGQKEVVVLSGNETISGHSHAIATVALDANIDFATPSNFFLHNNELLVFPYLYRFETRAKARWRGSSVLDVFVAEFPHNSSSYFSQAIAAGRITIDGKRVMSTTQIKSGQLLQHVSHRHECSIPLPPDCTDPTKAIKIVLDLPDYIIVDKPSGMPIHPCGRYRFNSVVGHMAAFHNIHPLLPVHRLDAGTSGIVMLAKNSTASRTMNIIFEASGSAKKMYLAQVFGEFPSEVVFCEESIGVVSFTPQMCACLPSTDTRAKPSLTIFRRVIHDAVQGTSVVQCWPVTGRTHQIRVHLQFLGHSIIGDALYGTQTQSESIPSALCDDITQFHSEVVGVDKAKNPDDDAAVRDVRAAKRPRVDDGVQTANSVISQLEGCHTNNTSDANSTNNNTTSSSSNQRCE